MRTLSLDREEALADHDDHEAFDLASYLLRALGYTAGLLIIVFATPLDDWIFGVLTAGFVKFMGGLAGLEITCRGAVIESAGLPARRVVGHWTVAPAWMVGLGFILAYPAPQAKKIIGAVLVGVNALFVNVLVIGWVAQAGPGYTAESGLYVPGHADLLAEAFAGGYPFLMAFVLVITLSYWMGRVVAEDHPGKPRRHARDVLPESDDVTYDAVGQDDEAGSEAVADE